MPTQQPIGRRRGSLAPLLLLASLWINGCQSPANRSEESVSSDTRWKVTGHAGPVSLRSLGQPFWHRATIGVTIVPGSQVATFEGSRLELASAGDRVEAFGPSRFTLPDGKRDGVRVRQDAGTLRYRVQSAPQRRFEVKTPHFSTVVKGTYFLVSTDPTSSEVSVEEGRVAVLDADGQPLAELTAGQTGRMDARPGATLDVSLAPGPSLEPGVGPGAEREGSAEREPASSGSPGATSGSLGSPTTGASILERIGGVLGAVAAQISTGDDLTSEGASRADDGGGGAREQESRSRAYGRDDAGRDDEDGEGKGKGHGHGKGHGKGKDHGKGHGKGNGKGQGQGRGKGAGEGANIFPDRDYLVGWNEHQ
jgi:hypothetical protein